MGVASGRIELWKFGANGMKWLKILHIFLSVLFLGGILSSFTLTLWLNLSDFVMVYATYRSMVLLSDNIVRQGAVGNLLLGVVYGAFTTWGFFKHKWLTAKWVIYLIQTILGIFVVDRLTVSIMALLEREGAAALHNPSFLYNHYLRLAVVLVQILLTLFILVVSVLKPWRNQKPQQKGESYGQAQSQCAGAKKGAQVDQKSSLCVGQ